MGYHQPVMLKESLEYLKVVPDGLYIDATLGDGGHTIEILKLGGKVLGIDVNEGSLDRATARIKAAGFERNFSWVRGNFKNIDELAVKAGFGAVNGILFDLGISSTQLESDEMGLSFVSSSPLDMRLDKELEVKAADLVNGLHEGELAKLFWEFGQERHAKRFAKEIVKARELERISSAKSLADIARNAFPGYENGRLHPATRLFMALRIAVNSEFENIKSALPRAGRLLLPGGRMVVITFHSLEDKIVKEFAQGAQPIVKVTKKPVVPSSQEIASNRLARSAKMRVFEQAL